MDLHEWQDILKRGDIVHHIGGGSGEIRCLQNSGYCEETNVIVIEATIRILEETVFNPIRQIPINDLIEFDELMQECPECGGLGMEFFKCECGDKHRHQCKKCNGDKYIKK